MNADCFFDVYNDTVLRQYLIDMCRAFSKLPESQEDLLQEAWIRIAESDADCTTEYYMHEGFKGMEAFYRRERRRDVSRREIKTANERKRRVAKKYIIRVAQSP